LFIYKKQYKKRAYQNNNNKVFLINKNYILYILNLASWSRWTTSNVRNSWYSRNSE